MSFSMMKGMEEVAMNEGALGKRAFGAVDG